LPDLNELSGSRSIFKAWLQRTTRRRKYGQTTNASRTFHQISLAKAMVNIQPADKNSPARLPIRTMDFMGFVPFEVGLSPICFSYTLLVEQHY
jgi:hypothetical protein